MRTISKLCLAASVLSAVTLAQTVVQHVPATAPPASEVPQTHATKPAPDLQPDTGIVIDQVYTNQYFGFRYTIPDDMAAPDVDVPPQNVADSAFVLLYVRDASKRRLTMTADGAEHYSGAADAARYMRKVTQNMRARGFEVLRESAEYTYAGQEFFRADYRKGAVYQSAVFTVRSGYALGLTATGATPEQVDELCETLTSLRFIGREEAAAASAMRGPALPAMGYVIVRPVPQTGQEPNGTSNAQPGPGCAQSSPGRVRVSEGVAEAMMVVSKVPPEYPPLARQARIQGQVRLHAVVGCDGSVRELRAISGHPMLLQAALNAVRQWRFKPYQLNGQAVEAETTITVDFKLE